MLIRWKGCFYIPGNLLKGSHKLCAEFAEN